MYVFFGSNSLLLLVFCIKYDFNLGVRIDMDKPKDAVLPKIKKEDE